MSSTACYLLKTKQLKTQRDGIFPLNGHDANLGRQDGLEEAPLHDAVLVGVAIDYLEGGQITSYYKLFIRGFHSKKGEIKGGSLIYKHT